MEKLIKVDINDNVLGEIEKLEAHKKPILHRAFSVFLIDGDKILIQKRAYNKYHSGGKWANSCCSHPRPNMDFFESVYNRIQLELGIDEKMQLIEVFYFTYLSKYAEDLFEYEYDHVLVGHYNQNKQINFNKDEIEEVKWIKISDLKNDLVNNPQNYATWYIICAPKVIEYLETLNIRK